MFKRKLANEFYQMLPYYIGEFVPKLNNIQFESARETLTEEVDEMVVKNCFERIYNMMECNLYMKVEDFPENKELSVYGCKDKKTNKIENFLLVGCESDISLKINNCSNSGLVNFLLKR